MSIDIRAQPSKSLFGDVWHEVRSIRDGGAHTYGPCSVDGCTRHARGGGICMECALSELQRRHGRYVPRRKETE